MKVLIFIKDIFKRFPFLLISNTVLLIFVSLFNAFSLFTISPVVDFFIHPDLKGISPLTEKAIGVLRVIGLPTTLGSWLIIFTIFIALSSISLVFVRYLILRTKYAVLKDILLGTFEDFFNAGWYFFSSGKQGTLLNTFTREFNLAGDAFGTVAFFFANILQVLFFLAVPFYISWQVTIISLGIAILFIVPFVLLGKLSYRLGILTTNTANMLVSVIHENLTLAKLVLGFGNRQKCINSLDTSFKAHRKAAVKSVILSEAIPILYRPFGVIMIVIALFAAHRFKVPLSEITVLLIALLQVAVYISNLAMRKSSLENFFPSYEQIQNLRIRAKELKQKTGSKEFIGFREVLRIEGFAFAYPAHKPVLTDINMRIPKGKMVAIVGESGAGKSTFIDLIMGFHQPTQGRIVFDKTPLTDFDILSYRRRIGYVPQDSVLFNMTIKDNLLWAQEGASDAEITQACYQANADEFIRRLPEGYNTMVGDRGVRLSGGQVQRVALARAILRKPELLILDEATSSLDTYSERLIQEAIENIAKNTTVIIIAHRLSTIVNADYIYVLKEGCLVEEGTYSRLMTAGGYFNHMVKLQALETVNK